MPRMLEESGDILNVFFHFVETIPENRQNLTLVGKESDELMFPQYSHSEKPYSFPGSDIQCDLTAEGTHSHYTEFYFLPFS